jgi:hypothetical protein
VNFPKKGNRGDHHHEPLGGQHPAKAGVLHCQIDSTLTTVILFAVASRTEDFSQLIPIQKNDRIPLRPKLPNQFRGSSRLSRPGKTGNPDNWLQLNIFFISQRL